MDASLGPDEVEHLEHAARIADRGWGHVDPNPMVGCVLVRDGVRISEGAHPEYGAAHAEIVALSQAGDARGATAYVTLEPCNHHGQTPPCVDALIESGVKRVVYGASDPGEKSGGGAQRLRDAGLDVVGPVWDAARTRAENPVFHHHAVGSDRPFVALKLALSLDGAVTAAAGVATRITGQEADEDVHRLRAGFDAVMVGSGTVRTDDPQLTIRHGSPGRTPTHRVVLVSDGRLRADARLFDGLDVSPLHLVYGETADPTGPSEAEGRGASVHSVPAVGDELSLSAVLAVCHRLGLRSVLCEGGAALGRGLLRADLVDRLILYTAPTVLGPDAVQAFDPGTASALRAFAPVLPPATFGRDTRTILDRREPD
ncbi:MAG: bifunctional diaminohydroxyphosphoribosylaminopyrimidine deaminase/5-amino-6-(5-phosphoribosylamino)uracil reductase RibD [Gemmatimonadota bacterium]